jgi:uncharacterized membrane protein YdbT with pleckstrin-like domain
MENTVIWRARKRNGLGLPWSFTVYSYDEERFYVQTGCFSQRFDEVRLYRITDISMKRSFSQRIFGMGTLLVNSSDKSLGDFEVTNIKDVQSVYRQLSDLVEAQRDKKRVTTREIVGGGHPDADDFHDHDHDDFDEQVL